MEFRDPNHGDLEEAKLNIATRWRNYEMHLVDDLEKLANSGFADRRLCAVAKTELEKAFLVIEKALRLGAPEDYAKAPNPPGGDPFRSPTDPAINVSEQRHVEWKDLNPPKD